MLDKLECGGSVSVALYKITVLYMLVCFILITGDYKDCTIVVWNTINYDILTTSKTNTAIHDLKWDPFSVNEFVSVGQGGSVLFWLLDETKNNVCLNVHEAEVPEELLQKHGVRVFS